MKAFTFNLSSVSLKVTPVVPVATKRTVKGADDAQIERLTQYRALVALENGETELTANLDQAWYDLLWPMRESYDSHVQARADYKREALRDFMARNPGADDEKAKNAVDKRWSRGVARCTNYAKATHNVVYQVPVSKSPDAVKKAETRAPAKAAKAASKKGAQTDKTRTASAILKTLEKKVPVTRAESFEWVVSDAGRAAAFDAFVKDLRAKEVQAAVKAAESAHKSGPVASAEIQKAA